MYGLKKCKLISYIIWTSSKKTYNLNCIIVIIFNYIRAYARNYTVIYNNSGHL